MRTDRLELLAKELLEHDSTVRFRMDIWVSRMTCGTACCAFGLATTIQEFQADGLGLDDKDTPCFEGFTGIGAAVRFFEITPYVAKMLFDPYRYERYEGYWRGWTSMSSEHITEQMVVDRIQAVVHGTPMPYRSL